MAGLAVFLAACGGTRQAAQPAIKENAFHRGKIDVATIEDHNRHEADITIAILAFRNNSADKSLDSTGNTLADLISAQLAARKSFKLVERQRIDDVLKELALGDAGPGMDQATAVRIGGMLGANVLSFGGFSTLGHKVILSMRLVKVETGEIVAGVNERTDDITKLDDMAQNAAAKLADALTAK